MSLTEKHLLIVDDSTVNIELMFDLLDEYGFENIHGINDPRQVLAHCQRQLPDLLLLDIRMPHLDGYAVIEELSEYFAEQMPPIIVLTAQIDDTTRQRALSMGVRDFITKPFKQDEVLQRIRNTLNIEHRYQVREKQVDTLELMVAKRTQELDRQSRTDPITQLPNRRGLSQALYAAALQASGTGLLFIAIDKLDDVVRLHGYRVADQLLRLISQRLRQQLDVEYLLGLWGGSELLVISPTANPTTLLHLAEKLLDCFDQDQALEELLLPLSARIGISAEAGYFETERLVHMAALALPSLESLKVQLYTPALETKQRHRLQLQQAIRGATERGEMSLAFQPKLSLADHKILGAEALLRWQHPEFGLISPGEFIPLAEASGDILSIGDWVLDEAMRYISLWRAQGLLNDDFHIAVNVAARQLSRKDFAHQLLARLEQRQIPQRFLALEVTESGLMSDMNHARQQLAQLAEMNIAVAIDDFGTGQSSLAYIKTLPFSTLKIDRAFVMDLETSAIDRQLAHTITQLAHSVGCDVVAEGIETSAQAAYLSSIGCEAAQGYFYARPLPAEAFVTWCSEWKPLLSTPPLSIPPFGDR
ncbi:MULTISPECIES: EAL domain-containing protein [unclassified Halomonas]|uniref:EAL domain-containing response regulator n=1 Tax=unclassified Halomonas TaxID=2609666 RepID=UPI0007D9FA4C|nr:MULTISPECIES: EAL domain-containing protein [unclassified Halomonas]MBT2785087.1 EAL domain-containing protein [Halomonas sp. ISL-106]MBT2796781.1 EAL domain-containing protein [Halomonas sp. ISL-104]OAL60009.1 diguanylate cyclase [Halomonas sp. ALS9]